MRTVWTDSTRPLASQIPTVPLVKQRTDRPSSASAEAARKTLRPQCPAGQSPKHLKGAAEKGQDGEGEVCGIDDAIHHGQSQLSDAPQAENDQCPVEDTEEWGDPMQDARNELEKIIREIEENSDPEAMREMRNRLKVNFILPISSCVSSFIYCFLHVKI